MCTVASLFLGYQWFLIIIFGGSLLLETQPQLCQVSSHHLLPPEVSQALGLLMQHSFLSAFCWMSAMSCEVWATFRQVGCSEFSHPKTCLTSWEEVGSGRPGREDNKKDSTDSTYFGNCLNIPTDISYILFQLGSPHTGHSSHSGAAVPPKGSPAGGRQGPGRQT